MHKYVYVVTGFDLGWDSVVGVFDNVPKEELLQYFPEGQYHISQNQLETSLINYEQ